MLRLLFKANFGEKESHIKLSDNSLQINRILKPQFSRRNYWHANLHIPFKSNTRHVCEYLLVFPKFLRRRCYLCITYKQGKWKSWQINFSLNSKWNKFSYVSIRSFGLWSQKAIYLTNILNACAIFSRGLPIAGTTNVVRKCSFCARHMLFLWNVMTKIKYSSFLFECIDSVCFSHWDRKWG